MTEVKQRAAAKKFVEDWTDKGYEKGEKITRQKVYKIIKKQGELIGKKSLRTLFAIVLQLIFLSEELTSESFRSFLGTQVSLQRKFIRTLAKIL